MNKNNLIVPRTGVIILRNNEILLTYSIYGKDEFWLVPGGGIEFEETMEECAIREVKEETGVDIKIEKFLYLREYIPYNGKDHVIDILFLGKIIGGKIRVGKDPDHTNQAIKKVKFIPIDKLKELKVYPKCLPRLIEEGLKNNFSNVGRYLGNCD